MENRNLKKIAPVKVYLVGAGPGDPGLITIRGMNLLRRAEVVIYDYLANERLLRNAPADAELIYVGKKGGQIHPVPQEEINQILVDKARAGRIVVRLKGGDPFIFGRGGEEIEGLVKAGIQFEVVPGVTSAAAAATYAGIPITHRQFTSSVVFITGHEDPTKTKSDIDWDKLASGAGTIVIYMGIKNLSSIIGNLIRHGRSPQTPVAVVRWASTARQRTVVGTLENIDDLVQAAGLRPPAIVVIGEVVALRETLNWFEKRPLFGKRVLITRTREQASELVVGLEELGAECREYAAINIEAYGSPADIERELGRLADYDYLLFTSTNAVRFFFQQLFARGLDSRALGRAQIGVVGRATAEALAAYGLRPDIVPDEFTGEELAASLLRQGVQGSKVLIPRALKAREELPGKLAAAGAAVTVLPIYRNVAPAGRNDALRSEFAEKNIDLVTFTSSSTVSNFFKMLGAESPAALKSLLNGVLVAAIGPITAKTAEEGGLTVQIQPAVHTIPELIKSIEAHFAAKA